MSITLPHAASIAKAQYEDIRKSFNTEAVSFCAHYHERSGLPSEIPAHYHEYIELIYVIEGTFVATVSGRDFVLSGGDLLIVNANEPHSFYRKAESKFICLQFDPFLLFSSIRTSFEARFIMPFIISCSSPQRVVKKAELDTTSIPGLIQNVQNEYSQKDYGYELSVRSDICRIFLWFLRKWRAQGLEMEMKESVRNEDIERLEKVLEYIDQNYMNTVSADKMAKLCNMSYSYFSRFFKASVGRSFSEYLTYVRVTEAEKRLISTGKSISQIAYETGFSNASYFITQFKRYRNMTPKKFKQRLFNEDISLETPDDIEIVSTYASR